MTEERKMGVWQKLRALGWVGIGITFAAGVLFWGGFNWAVEATNSEEFCLSCHEMQDYVYEEYQHTIHYQNRSGVRAVCADCHVPKEWGPQLMRKVHVGREVYGKIMGSINTPEKFEANRLRMAEKEWRRMKANDSRECRNCHGFAYFDYSVPGRASNQAHQRGLTQGMTCIDCHKGIAHSLPPLQQSGPVSPDGAMPVELFHPAPER